MVLARRGSELPGHAQPLQGFGHASRITPGYAHATYNAMRRAVDSLEYAPVEHAFENAGADGKMPLEE